MERKTLEEIEIAVPETVTYDNNANWRVVGGEDAEPGQFPYIVSLRRTNINSHMCGGTIISNVYILTACHCTLG